MSFIIKGTFVDTPKIGELRTREGEILVKDGKVQNFAAKIENKENLTVYDYTGKIIVPGLIDLHLHAPQYSYAGTAMDLELLDWLSNYTFPEESKYKDLGYAKGSYEIFVNDCIKSATTRFVVFGTLHTDATLELMEQFEKSKLVSYIGKVCMNRNSPDFYTESTTENGVKETMRWIDEVVARKYKNTYPIITPRFTPSCTDDYMKQLGIIATDKNLAVQSHLSENTGEIDWVKSLCPDTNCYGESYSRYDLFGGKNKTVMAHCVHCPQNEEKLIKDNKVFIAHCPISNEDLSSGICPAGKYLREEYNIGLGTDISGGHSLNMFDVMKASIECSKLRWKYVDQSIKALNIKESLYLATVGGGKFFGDNVGLFENNYEFDAIVLDESELHSLRKFNVDERIERYTYLGKGKLHGKFVKGEKLF